MDDFFESCLLLIGTGLTIWVVLHFIIKYW